jgi:DNA repair exonuclease SbcCD nuclease subunit
MVFTSEKLSAFYLSGINTLIHGYAFTSPKHEENPLEEGVNLDKSKINILCAHTDLDVPLSVYAPITSGQLAASGFDYAALGHVHRAPAPTIYGKTLTAYSGCLEGRSFDEPDFGGFMEVTVDDNTVKCEKISIAKHRYMIETLDITGVRSDGDIISRLRRHIALCDYSAVNYNRHKLRQTKVCANLANHKKRRNCRKKCVRLQIMKNALHLDSPFFSSSNEIRLSLMRLSRVIRASRSSLLKPLRPASSVLFNASIIERSMSAP